jgi:hypothetical protein
VSASYISGEYPMYYLAIKRLHLLARRGRPVRVDPPHNLGGAGPRGARSAAPLRSRGGARAARRAWLVSLQRLELGVVKVYIKKIEGSLLQGVEVANGETLRTLTPTFEVEAYVQVEDGSMLVEAGAFKLSQDEMRLLYEGLRPLEAALARRYGGEAMPGGTPTGEEADGGV